MAGPDRAWLAGWPSVFEHLDTIWINCSFNGARFQDLTLQVSKKKKVTWIVTKVSLSKVEVPSLYWNQK